MTATENNDFTFNDQAVVFQPGNTQVTRQVIINNDNAVEAVEFFNVVLTSTDGNVEIGDPDTTIVTINDNDGTSIKFFIVVILLYLPSLIYLFWYDF